MRLYLLLNCSNGGEGHIEQRRSDENHGESDSLGKSKPAIRALGDEPRAINQGATAEDQCCCDPERDAEGGDIAIDFLSTQPLSERQRGAIPKSWIFFIG